MVEHNILYQDNKSTILLATNGRMSSSKRTKHIKHRFFLVKDLVDRGELKIRYEPTESMWSDILTKAKQGRPFREMRAELMNCPANYDDEVERKQTHPKLLPADDSAATPVPENDRSGNAHGGVVKLPNKRTVSPVQRRSVLSDNQLALVYLAVDKARPGGRATNEMLVRRGLLAEARD